MMNQATIDLEWAKALKDYFQTEAFASLTDFIQKEYTTKKVYPVQLDIFRAFSLTPFSKVQVVILGQDPYHGDGQAHGLSFSVPAGVAVPPSLKNIYKEIESDLGIKKDFKNGNLESWATQGVLLLNTVLSVVAGRPASHKDCGWEKFTDTVITKLSNEHEHLIFMLWGNFAKSKKALIDTRKHLVLEAAHPSPFSVHSGFFSCKHFSKCNEYLRIHNKKEIVW
jgi:uracil-DNA glycosylase